MNRRQFVLLSSTYMAAHFCDRSLRASPMVLGGRTQSSAVFPISVAWLKAQEGCFASTLFNDSRFPSLFVNTAKSSRELRTISEALGVLRLYTAVSGRIELRQDRYITGSGCMTHCGFNRGFFWSDAKSGKAKHATVTPLTVVVLSDVNGPVRRLRIVTNGDLAKNYSALREFERSFSRWFGKNASKRNVLGGDINAFDALSLGTGEPRLTPEAIGLKICNRFKNV